MNKKICQISDLIDAIGDLDESTFQERDLFHKKAALVIKSLFGENYQHLADWRKIEIPIPPPLSGDIDAFFDYKDEWNTGKQKMTNLCEVMIEDLKMIEQSKATKTCKHEDLEDETKKAIALFDEIVTHPQIKETSSIHFKNGKYRSSVLDAAIRLEEMVKEKSKYPKDNRGRELSGVSLMHTVFDVNNPILVWCKNKRQIDKDELDGYKLIFAGTVLGIRDPKAHSIFEIKPMRAIKLLTLITLLAELVDASKYASQSQTAGSTEKIANLPTKNLKNIAIESPNKLRIKIKEDLSLLRKQIISDLGDECYQSRAFPTDVYMTLKDGLMREVDIETFRKIQETYLAIDNLRFPINDRKMNRQKYEEAIFCIDESIKLLK